MKRFTQLSITEMKNVLGGLYDNGGGGGGVVGSCSMFLPNGNGAPGSSYSAACTVGTQNSSGGYDHTVIGVSRDEALAMTQGMPGAHWCCEHCSTATWMKSCNPS